MRATSPRRSGRKSTGSVLVRLGTAADDAVCGSMLAEALLASEMPARLPHAHAVFADASPFPCATSMRRLATVEGEPVGFIDFDPIAGRVHYLIVRPGDQRRGIGAALLAAAEAAIAGAVSLSVLEVNEHASAWYARRGYRIVERRHDPDWHGGPAAWLELRLARTGS